MYQDYIKLFKTFQAIKTNNPLVIADRPPIPYDDPDATYIYEHEPLSLLSDGRKVDAALELRGKGAFLLPRMSYADMQSLVAVPGMLVFVDETQGVNQPTVYMSIPGQGNSVVWTPFFSEDQIVLEANTQVGSILQFKEINQRGQNVLAQAQALVRPQLQVDSKRQNDVDILQVQFSKNPSSVYDYISIDNISELKFVDYAKLSINSVDYSRVPHYFLEAFANTKDFPGTKHEQITTVISGGNSQPFQPTTTAATLEIAPGDSLDMPFACFMNGRMSQSTINLMMLGYIGDNLEGMSWFNTDLNRHQFALKDNGFNGYSTLIPAQEFNNGFSIGEKAYLSNLSHNSFAIGFNADINGNAKNSFVVGSDVSTKESNHIVLGNNSFVSINEKKDVDGDIPEPLGSLTIGGHEWGDSLLIKPHMALKPLSIGAVTLDSEAGYFFLGSNNQFFLKNGTGTTVLNVETTQVKNTKFISNTPYTTSLESSFSLTHDLRFILPQSDGIPGQFLQTDGFGNLGWGSSSFLFEGVPNEIIVQSSNDSNSIVRVGIANDPIVPGKIGMTLPGGTLAEVQQAESQRIAPVPIGTIRFVIPNI